MCDTLVALPSHTASGNLLLAKNSDREPDEAQVLLRMPARMPDESTLDCTFISIPQARRTNEVILSKPYQMWGAEMGVNEHGVAIGNEAVFTNVRIAKTNQGLTGMDLLRLALERSDTARSALECITGLLETYGQDACGGYKNKKFFYHNSFLIADAENAFILETAGRSWAYKRVDGYGSISNGLTIGSDYEGLHAVAEKRVFPYRPIRGKVGDFRAAYSDFIYTRAGRAARRQACTSGFLASRRGELSAEAAMEALRQHHVPDGQFNPQNANTADLCMHATGLLNPSQTTGSMVAEIRRGKPSTVWLTGTSMPCLSVYIPCFFQSDALLALKPASQPDDGSFWWKAERLHRWVCRDYQQRKKRIRPELDKLQAAFLAEEKHLFSSRPSQGDLHLFSERCLQALEALYRMLGAAVVA